MEVLRDRKHIAATEGHRHRQSTRLVKAGAGGVALANQQGPGATRVTQPMATLRNGAPLQKLLAPLGIQELQRPQRAIAIMHRDQQ